MIELRKLIDIIPHLSIGGMENMGPIGMNMDALFFLTINISAQMFPAVNNKTFFPFFLSLMSKHTAKESAAHNQIIIFHIGLPAYISFPYTFLYYF